MARKATTTAKAQESAKPESTAKAQPKPKKPELPATPDGWKPGLSQNGFVRYARRLRGSGQPVSAYRVSGETTNADKAMVAKWRKDGVVGDATTFVVVNHTTGTTQGFNNWATAYAFTCAMTNPALAPSVVASLGKSGVAAVDGATARVVAKADPTPATPAKADTPAKAERTPRKRTPAKAATTK